jgi:hypothetical protein
VETVRAAALPSAPAGRTILRGDLRDAADVVDAVRVPEVGTRPASRRPTRPRLEPAPGLVVADEPAEEPADEREPAVG